MQGSVTVLSEITSNVESIELDPTKAAFGSSQGIQDLGHTHFIGIGGAGMSVLAEILHEQGVVVSGSDRSSNAKTQRLQSFGITVSIGHDASHVHGAKTVVYSSAVRADNPEIVEAVRQGSQIVHRSDILSLIMQTKHSVTVAGAHGKTTTSSLLAHILSQGQGSLADPSYAIGGSIQSSDGGILDGGHAGSGSAFVAEADESDGSFGKYHPDIVVITNVEADHLDHYGTAERYREAFVRHAGHAKRYVVICGDDEGALQVLKALDAQVLEHTIVSSTRSAEELGDLHEAALVQIVHESEHEQDGAERFTLIWPPALSEAEEGIEIPVQLRIPGIHNARNATAAIVAAHLLGMGIEQASAAAAGFLGASRRFQLRGQADGVQVVDDYAHHPTEIEALLQAARRRYPQARLHVLFQPHLFSRTKFFAHEFAQALSLADDVIVTGVYPAREKQEDFPGVGAQSIVDEAQGMKPSDNWISAVADMQVAAQMVALRVRSGDVVFTVGAGDITDMGPVVVHALQARESSGH